MPPGVGLNDRLKNLLVNKRAWGLVALAVLAGTYPLSFGVLGGHLVTSKLAAKLGVPVEYKKARAGWGGLRISDLTVGPKDRPLLTVAMADISFAAAWGAGTITLQSPSVDIRRGGEGDNASALLERLRRPAARGSGDKGRSYPILIVNQGSVQIQDAKSDVSVAVAHFDATWEPSRRFSITASDVDGHLSARGNDNAPAFGAKTVTVEGPLSGMRPHGFPEISVKEGHVRILSTLPLTGITGSLRPVQAGEDAVDVLFAGSYAGAKRSLWTATGKVKPAVDWSNVDGEVALRAERFSLDKIAEVLPASVLDPENTEIDAAVEARFSGRRVTLSTKLDVAGLSILHEKLAAEPVEDASFSLRFDATIDRDQRRLDLSLLEGKIGSLLVRISGSVEIPAGTFRFKDGHELRVVPKIDLSLRVPRTACAKILTSIPAPLVPKLQGFALQGLFEADLHTKIDFDNLDALEDRRQGGYRWMPGDQGARGSYRSRRRRIDPADRRGSSASERG